MTSEAWERRRPSVGQVAERSRRVETADIERFTAMSGDRNPLHYDAKAAAETPFGEIVVQGGVTTALLNALVAEDLPGPGTVFVRVEWDFTAPVRPGDVLTARAEVTAVRPDKPVTTLATTIRRDDGGVVVRGSAVCYTFVLP